MLKNKPIWLWIVLGGLGLAALAAITALALLLLVYPINKTTSALPATLAMPAAPARQPTEVAALLPSPQPATPRPSTPSAAALPSQTPPGTPTPFALFPSSTPSRTPTSTLRSTRAPTPDPWVNASLAEMDLKQKVGQLLMVAVDGDELTQNACQKIQDITPAGVFYQAGNVHTPGQLVNFTLQLQACAREGGMPPLLIALDHEGEFLDHFDSGVTNFPTALALGATGDPESAYRASLASGGELASTGVNMVLGPVADVLLNPDNGVVSLRTYGGDASQVSLFVRRSVAGYREAGLIATLKHFPGHGGAAEDSHSGLVVDRARLSDLETSYLPSFQAGIEAGAQAVMLSHVAFPALNQGNVPTTFSAPMVRLLRDELGFEGVIMTDNLGMKAVAPARSQIPDAALRAVQAGADLLLMSDSQIAPVVFRRLVQAFKRGELPMERLDDAVRRLLTLKARNGLKGYPPRIGPQADLAADGRLAQELGAQAVTVYSTGHGALVPLPALAQRILVIGPNPEWPFYKGVLQPAFEASGKTVDFIYYTTPLKNPVPETGLVTTLPLRTAGYDVTILLTWNSHLNRVTMGDTWPSDLVAALSRTGRPLVVAALTSPTDLLEFPGLRAFICTFGTTRGQMQGLVEILLGTRQATGKNPLPGLP
jgi:beta-N-acetylhexosaminidase